MSARSLFLRSLLPLLAMLLFASSALAVDVYLNGVKITGQKGLELKEVDVSFDPAGNVLITSERYQVNGQSESTTSAVPTGNRPTKTYWLVSTEVAPGESHYAVEVLVNGRWVATYKSGGSQLLRDITEFLTPGTNKIEIRARKEAGYPANPASNGEVTILLGEGESTEGKFIMRRTHIKYQRRAGEGDHFNEEFDLEAE